LATELEAFAMRLGAFALELVAFCTGIRHGYNDSKKLTACHEIFAMEDAT